MFIVHGFRTVQFKCFFFKFWFIYHRNEMWGALYAWNTLQWCGTKSNILIESTEICFDHSRFLKTFLHFLLNYYFSNAISVHWLIRSVSFKKRGCDETGRWMDQNLIYQRTRNSVSIGEMLNLFILFCDLFSKKNRNTKRTKWKK